MASAEVKLLLLGERKKSRLQTGRTDGGRYVMEVRLSTFTVILCTFFRSGLNLQIVLASHHIYLVVGNCYLCFMYVLAFILCSSVKIVASPCEYFAVPV